MSLACRPLCTMREALADPAIFADILPGETWAPWRVILIACRGEPLTDDERAIFTALTGREHEPEQPVEELWGIVGRRGGKSRAFSMLGSYLAGLLDYGAVAAPGERIKLPIMAATTMQAAKAFSYVLGVFTHSEEMRDMVEGEPTVDTIRLKAGVDIEVRPANFRTIRGETLAAALCDEVAYWHLEGCANPDTEILDEIRPGLATTGGPLCVFSSPYARKGEVFATYQRQYGASGDPAVLMLKAASRVMNPSLSETTVARAFARDAAKASAECRRRSRPSRRTAAAGGRVGGVGLMSRSFSSIGALANFLDGQVRTLPQAQHAALDEASTFLLGKVRAIPGTYQSDPAWPKLAEATVADRVRQSFTPDDPLKRTGAFAETFGRKVVSDTRAGVGSDDPRAEWFEHGTRHMPPRPVLGAAKAKHDPELVGIVGRRIQRHIGGRD